MDAKGIIKEYLEKNDYDGLYSEDCGCFISDLIPCGEPFDTCMPGYLGRRVSEMGLGYIDIISPRKEGEK